MPVYTVETPGGKKLDIETENEHAAIATADAWHEQNSGKVDAATDLYKSIDAGVASGTAGLLGTPRYLIEKGAQGIGAVSDTIAYALGVEPYRPPANPGLRRRI